jgi:hypothetical protein
MSEQKSIHQLLKESSSNNEGFQCPEGSSVVVMQTAHNDMKTTRIIPNNLSLRTNPISSKLAKIVTYCATNVALPPLADAESAYISSPHSQTPFSPVLSPSQEFLKNGASKVDAIKNWSISTYKCTRQVILEKVGKTDRTTNTGKRCDVVHSVVWRLTDRLSLIISPELEQQINDLRETQRKYHSILRLSRTFSTHFHQVVATQRKHSQALN